MAEYRVAYLVLFLLSLLSVFLYMRMYTKQHGIHYIVFGIVGCLVCLFYYYCSLANTPDEYRLASQNVYAAMVFLPVIVVRMVCDICKVRDSWARDIPILISAVLLILIITTQRTGLFYREFSVDPVTGELNIVHGPVYYLYLTHIVLSLVAVIVLLVRRRKADISMFCFFCVQVMALILVLTSIIVQVLPYGFDWMPVGIVIADVWMLLLCGRLPLYDISSVICETEEEAGKTGILILDSKMRLLGFNAVTAQRFPDITSCRIDAHLPDTLPNYGDLMVMVEDLERAGEEQTLILSAEEGYYSLSLDYLRMNGRICGYQLISTDVTDQQRYIHLIENFKEQLEEEVRVKTEDILNMQDTMLLGIAELVESRDNSTGGHIKRTRRVVEILVEELRKENLFTVPPTFYDMLVKAAPLHDLGKIAVDDAVLRKPGRFTPEEFDQMKRHAPEGRKMTRRVLEDINDGTLVSVVANMAGGHHERWDGSGYPNHLQGEDIPLEARIMAVADVYDALVSRRCYKDAFDFEKARSIITEGMGSQFDPQLAECFARCIPQLEEYYLKEQAAEADPS